EPGKVILEEECHSSSCIEANKCSGSVMASRSCPTKGEVCCSMIKAEDRHRCGHFGGVCMNKCAPTIQVKQADDCSNGETCCVLV
ncbi:uncharacterized protein LOC106646394, partial [Copidosoma floridanum]|uniref:uncharacterized protein LOC106646394 n=1 Tax=Copidosoma floridanum TaxID=29053 RepID=UPI0006C9A5A2